MYGMFSNEIWSYPQLHTPHTMTCCKLFSSSSTFISSSLLSTCADRASCTHSLTFFLYMTIHANMKTRKYGWLVVGDVALSDWTCERRKEEEEKRNLCLMRLNRFLHCIIILMTSSSSIHGMQFPVAFVINFPIWHSL
jgi:hypothetical protein